MTLENITAIVTAASAALTDLGVMPYVLAGAVIALIGRFIISAKKAGR